ncbi:MAG TPA: hypothetical protein VL172_12485, partial [Kofleriaceae bacterium]|nr:hypothetical protein [Kofleriaceae bacterium]
GAPPSADATGLAAPPAAAPPPSPRRLTEPGGCPYMPAFVDDDDLVFDDGNGDLHVLRGDAARPQPLVTDPQRNDWRAARGRRPGEAVFVAAGSQRSDAGFVDVRTGAVELMASDSGTFAAAGDALFYARTDLPEIRRRWHGEDTRIAQLPAGLWAYTVAASADGRRLAVTTAQDRSSPTLCLVDVARGDGGVDCLPIADGIAGRAAFAPDGTLFYQTAAGIHRRAADGTDALWLPGAYAYSGIDVAPGGRALVYADSRPTVEVAPLDALDAPVLRGDLHPPAATPDGHWLYVRIGAAGDELVDRASDGSTRVLAARLGRMSFLQADAGGGRVVFDVDGPQPGIHVLDTTPYPPVRITTSAGDSNPVWTADGRIAFTRWDEQMRPSVMLADPAHGVRGDADRRPALPVPRVSLAPVHATGEIVLIDMTGHSLSLWNPVSGRERTLDIAALGGRAILQAAPSPDGRWLALLTEKGAYEVWRLPIPSGPRDRRAAEQLFQQPPCATLDTPAYDAAGRLYMTTKPWRGDIYRVDLAPG